MSFLSSFSIFQNFELLPVTYFDWLFPKELITVMIVNIIIYSFLSLGRALNMSIAFLVVGTHLQNVSWLCDQNAPSSRESGVTSSLF